MPEVRETTPEPAPEIPETTPEPAPAAPKRRIALFIVIAAVILLPLLYLGGNFILPAALKAGHQGKNCSLALGLNSLYTSLYPAVIADQSIAGPVGECALYSVATANEEKKAWQDSYNAYKSYAETYPTGLFVKETHEHTAVVLTAWSQELLAARKYEQAVGNLELVFKSYANTPSTAEAGELMSAVYTAWGTDQRESSDFAGSETTFKAFKTWAGNAKQVGSAKTAQRELAQTYLAWGLALQSQKLFEDAKAKLDLAIASDPEPLAKAGPAALAKTAQAKLYTQWGDDLIEKKDFPAAIERYKTVVTLSESKDQPAAKDAVANGYLQWAASLSESEDFLGALKQVEEAGKQAATDAATKSVQSAKTDTYTAFSNSSGPQARKAMKDAAKAACEAKKKPDLPIFGIDKDKTLAAIYGVDDILPANVAAKTPGAMHYVACIEMEVQTVGVKTFYWAKLVREKYKWNITLRQVATNTASATTSIEGGTPPPLPEITRSNYLDILLGGSFQRYRGTNPDVVALANWLLTVMK